VINIDKQHVAAVRKLEALGYSYQDGERGPASPSAAAGPRSLMTAESDNMLAYWGSGQMPSRAVLKDPRKSASSPP